MEPFADQLFSALKELGIIDEKKLTLAYEESKAENSSFQESLLNRDLITDQDLARTVADIYKVPTVELAKVQIPPELVFALPEEYARNKKVILFGKDREAFKLAAVDPSSVEEIRPFVEQKMKSRITVYYATERDFEKVLKNYKQNLQQSFDEMLKARVEKVGKEGISEAPIQEIVNILIEYAYTNGASDMHIEPEGEKSIVRFRVDGVLQEVLNFSPEIHEQVISRIKFLAHLRIDEHMNAQDGKIRIQVEKEDLDIRVSIVPVVHGEKTVLRLLSSRYRQFGLADLGMSKLDLQKVTDAFQKPFGMILSTGPTGSGKTTTIYAILKILNTKKRNIATIEDPVEYEIAGINQIQENVKTNLTFAEGLRSILRQDPDVIYVGEIRDNETADIAVNAAMTGHLVLSTLHTNDSATALPRLLDMEIEPFLVSSTVNVVIAQRLVRRICDRCKFSVEINPASKDELVMKQQNLISILPKELVQKHFGKEGVERVYQGKGCPVCRNTGYVGRVGIFEVLEISETIKDLIVKKSDAQTILNKALSEGLVTMMEDGVMKVQQGITTIEEVLRVTKE